MNSSAILYALSLIPGIGAKTLRDLLVACGSPEDIWGASKETLLATNGIGPKTVTALLHGKQTIDPETEWKKIVDQDINILTFIDADYPKLLKEIPDAPMILFTRGDFTWNENPLIALVGSRRCTSYGTQAAQRIATDLASAGYTVVSGMAFGIDSIAHKAALDAGGKTLAVLGGGVDDISIAPQTHLPLARAIMHAGALISEYPPGTRPAEGTFPARNRIVAGMCLGTIIIEAAEKSGALITAHLALDYNREVFAVPGSIFSPSSLGTNRLIKAGAKIVTSVSDILEEFPLTKTQSTSSAHTPFAIESSLSPNEQKILALLSHEPLHVDKIIKAVTLETATVNSFITLLEIKGLVKNVGGMHYIRTGV